MSLFVFHPPHSPDLDLGEVVSEQAFPRLKVRSTVVAVVDRRLIAVDQRGSGSKFRHARALLSSRQECVEAATQVTVQPAEASGIPDNGNCACDGNSNSEGLTHYGETRAKCGNCCRSKQNINEGKELAEPCVLSLTPVVVERGSEEVEPYLFFGGLTPGGEPPGDGWLGGVCGTGRLLHLTSFISNASPYRVSTVRRCGDLRCSGPQIAQKTTLDCSEGNSEMPDLMGVAA